MRRLNHVLIVSSVGLTLSAGSLVAQDRRDDGNNRDEHHQPYVRHDEWKKGEHMRQEDWNRAERVDDYQRHHLRHPPHGYEWREVDGNYVLGAASTGVIASVVAAEPTH